MNDAFVLYAAIPVYSLGLAAAFIHKEEMPVILVLVGLLLVSCYVAFTRISA
jgi:hypothetical protein